MIHMIRMESYNWINPTYPMSITGVITHLQSGMSHQVYIYIHSYGDYGDQPDKPTIDDDIR